LTKMDDDYNVVGTYGDDSITYPSNEDVQDENCAMTSLNDIGYSRAAKRLRNELEKVPADDIYIHPIDWHMRTDCGAAEKEVKRAKKEADDACIERATLRIIQARERRSLEGWTMERRGKEEEEINEDDDQQHLVMDRPPIDGSPWIGISNETCEDRLYIRLLRARKKNRNMKTCNWSKTRGLSVFPIDKLMNEVNSLKECRIREKAAREVDEIQKEDEERDERKDRGTLWVNKYSPTNFTHLLSPDAANRQVVQWLRLWDECVFGKIIPDCLLEEDGFSMDDESPRRPLHRILVISGKAGLGKSTLASIAARLVGYSVVETNASDNRSVADLEKVIESAIRSTRTLDGERRPMCVILDEVDGAPVETIRWLVKTMNNNDKKKIRRPIIAICNNLYTPALRELRTISMIVTLGETKRTRLIQRLSQIVDEENLIVDQGAIETLTRLSATDIRLSLNVLQYLSLAANANARRVSSSEVEAAIDRVRSPTMNMFAHWSTVLEWANHLDKKGCVLSLSSRLEAVEKVIMEEDGERLLTAIHHNYLSIPNLTSDTLSAVTRMFSSMDEFSTMVAITKNFGLMKYVRMQYLSLHASIASHAKAALQYPSQAHTNELRGKQSEETVDSVRRSMVRLVSKKELVVDTLPLVVSIVQPSFKTMNKCLFTKQEEGIYHGIVASLTQFGLTFAPIAQDGAVNYIFCPSVDVLTMYSVSRTHRRMLSNNHRKIIAHEVLLSSVRNPAHERSCPASSPISLTLPTVIPEGKTRPRGTLALQSSHSFPIQSNIPLHFRYNNHFSNAVKRNVRMFHLFN
ncbi:hypothetical protein PFISCL1PPCAC_15606, partial [Pristionchus fissidentatus]